MGCAFILPLLRFIFQQKSKKKKLKENFLASSTYKEKSFFPHCSLCF